MNSINELELKKAIRDFEGKKELVIKMAAKGNVELENYLRSHFLLSLKQEQLTEHYQFAKNTGLKIETVLKFEIESVQSQTKKIPELVFYAVMAFELGV